MCKYVCISAIAIFYSSGSFENLSPEAFFNYIDLEGTGVLLKELVAVAGKPAVHISEISCLFVNMYGCKLCI